jgi:hypothetical protein
MHIFQTEHTYPCNIQWCLFRSVAAEKRSVCQCRCPSTCVALTSVAVKNVASPSKHFPAFCVLVIYQIKCDSNLNPIEVIRSFHLVV